MTDAAASLAGIAMSQTMDHKLVTPAEIQWEPGPAVLPAGIRGAVLYGDPTKDGLFSMRFKLPKGYRVPPHTLSKAGLFTVISGTFRIGTGEKADPSKAKAMPAGSFIALAPGTPHFVWPWTRRRWFSSTMSARGRSPTSTRKTTRARSRSNPASVGALRFLARRAAALAQFWRGARRAGSRFG